MNKVNKLYEIVRENNMTNEEVINLFLNYHGTQLITDEFIEFIEDEGYYIPNNI